MMEKSIRENKIEIFLNLVKDGVNVPMIFDESTLFRQIMNGGAPILPTLNKVQSSSKEIEPMVTTSAMPTSGISTQSTLQLSAKHIQKIISAMPNTTTHASIL